MTEENSPETQRTRKEQVTTMKEKNEEWWKKKIEINWNEKKKHLNLNPWNLKKQKKKWPFFKKRNQTLNEWERPLSPCKYEETRKQQ